MRENNTDRKDKEGKAYSLFLIIWSGELLSSIGSGLTAFTLSAYAFSRTGLASSAAVIYLLTFLPAFVLRPAGGVLADRADRRMVMAWGNTGSAAGILLILVMMSFNIRELWVIYPGAVISSVFTAFHNPSYKASVSDFLPEEYYEKASGLMQLSGSAQFLIAPIIAGFLMSFADIRFILSADIMTFLFSSALILTVRSKIQKPSKKRGETTGKVFLKEMAEGFRTISENRGILYLTLLVSLILFYVGLLQSLLGPMVLSFEDPAFLGMAQSICASGMLLSSVFIGGFGRMKRHSVILSLSLALMGVFFSFIGIRESLIWIIIPGFLFFSTLPFVNSSVEVMIRKNISNDRQGRAWAVISFITFSGSIIAYAAAGYLSDRIFNPLFIEGGRLSGSLGMIFGVGQGRGIAFIFFISGLFTALLSICIYLSRDIRSLDKAERTGNSPEMSSQIRTTEEAE